METVEAASHLLLHTESYWALLLALMSVLSVVSFINTNRQKILPNVPIVGLDGTQSIRQARENFRNGSKTMLLEGYRKYKGNPFYVPTKMGERLMIPPKYVEELKNAPASQADFPATFVEMFEGQITTIGTEQTLHPQIIKIQLNQYLASVLPDIDAEISESLSELIPDCRDWTEVIIGDVLTNVVARASSRMFGGVTLSRHHQWTKTMIDFTNDSFLAAQRLKDFPGMLRPAAKYFIPEVARLFQHFALANELIVPILNDREKTQQKLPDLLQWMSENAQGRSKSTLSAITLHVAFAAIHTSAIAVTHILYDLCAMPEYVQPLREEIESALAAEGDLPTKKAFLKMSKLDSFMRESQRFNPLLLITYERLIRKDLRLSDGFVIPANTQIGVPAHAIGLDDSLYPDADTFDGFRFHKLRRADPTSGGQQQYIAANLSNMSWGYGSHACPGRWFADAEIKIIVIQLLLKFDFRFPEGKGRPMSLEFETQNLPDRGLGVLFRRRGSAE